MIHNVFRRNLPIMYRFCIQAEIVDLMVTLTLNFVIIMRHAAFITNSKKKS